MNIRVGYGLARKRADAELHRLNRALSALSKGNDALVHATDEAQLLSQICEIVVQVGGYRLAWVGYAEHDGDKTVRLMAKSGVDDGYTEKAQITWDDTERGCGPGGTAIKTGKVCVLRDILQNPQFRLWRDDAVRRGYASVISLPLREGSQAVGVLNIYAHEPDAFDDREVNLLKELASNLAYGVASLRNATERRRTEAALRESEAKFRSFVEESPFGIFRSSFEGDRFLDVNPALVKMLGYASAEEALSITLTRDLYLTPQDRERTLAQLRRDRGCNGIEVRWRRKNGETITASLSGRLVRESVGGGQVFEGIVEDITERNRAEQALREGEERFRQVVEGAPVGMFIETDGILRYFNPAALAIFGAESASQIVGQGYLEIVHPDTRASVTERAHMVREERKAVPFMEERLLRLDGTVFDGEVTAVPFIFEGRSGALVFVRDITQRKREEETRRALEHQLRQAQKMEAVGRLAGGVAHDFNNLIMVIQSYTEMLQDSLPANNTLQKNTQAIMKAADRAASLTGQMLAFSRQQVTSPVVLDLNAEVNEAARMLKRLIGENIEFRVDSAKSLWAIEADSNQIDQVLMNLCVNARDAMPHGGALTIATRNVAAGEARIGRRPFVFLADCVTLSVTDTGMGISEDLQERIFEPFFTTKEVGKGTGLGLAMVYGIVKQSGGQVWVDSEPGQGACFTISLPRANGAAYPEIPAKAEEQARGTGTLLIAEDEEALREAMSDYMRSLGYTVLVASSGQEALSLACEHEGQIDLLITDVVMPKVNGRELSQMLASLRPDLKTIYISGYTDEAVLRHGIQEFAASFMQKPFSLGALARQVRDRLG